jgi:hypothetical protein
MASYDPKKVNVSIARVFVTGFSEEDIETEYNDEDAVKENVGIHGEVSYTEGVDYSGNIKIALKQSSPSNVLMERLLYSQTEFPFLLKDISTGSPITIASDVARVKNKPTRSRGLEETSVEWRIAIPDLRPVTI